MWYWKSIRSKLRSPTVLCILAFVVYGIASNNISSLLQLDFDGATSVEDQTFEDWRKSEELNQINHEKQRSDYDSLVQQRRSSEIIKDVSETEKAFNTHLNTTSESNLSSSRLSPSSGYLMYVLTLQDVKGADASNENRFDHFKRHWSIICNNTEQAIQKHQQYVPEEIHFHKCPGNLSPKGTKFGYGLSMAYLECFNWALNHHRRWHADHNTESSKDIPFIFLEDDARLYNSNFCHTEYRNRLWDATPSNATLLMLGGHNLFLRSNTSISLRTDGDATKGNGDNLPTFLKPNLGAGSYGFVILKTKGVEYMTRKLVKMLNRTFTQEGMADFMGIDKQFYVYPMLQVYITQPWLVYHEGGLYSNNKNRIRGEYGDGSRQYRWVPGLTGSFRNCTDDNSNELAKKSDNILMLKGSSNIQLDRHGNDIQNGKSVSGRNYKEESVTIACRTVVLRIPQSLTSLQNQTKSNRVIAAVRSNSSRTSWRSTIRSTWGKPGAFSPSKIKATNPPEVNVFFLVAGAWEEVASEFQEHQDLIWIDTSSDLDTTWSSLPTLQIAAFLKLVNDYAASRFSFLLRVPDDAYVNLPGIRAKIMSRPQQTRAMWGGKCDTGVRPSHLGVPETEYSDYFFPQYCRGNVYALSADFVDCAASQLSQTRIVSLDDAYMGLLGERCGLSASQFFSSGNRALAALVKTNITKERAMHRYYGQQQMFW